MENLHKDIINGLLSFIAIFGFISGEFVASAILFGTAAIFANIDLTNRLPINAHEISSR